MIGNKKEESIMVRKKSKNTITRRNFLKAATASMLAPAIVPSSVFGKSSTGKVREAYEKYISEND